MTPDDRGTEETPEDEDSDAIEEDSQVWSFEKLRARYHAMVDEALSEALHVRSKGRAARIHLAREMGRVRDDMRRAFRATARHVAGLDLESLKKGLRGRTNTLMTRVKDAELEQVDLLVDAGLFESRSACVAFLIHAGLESRRDLVDKVRDTAQRIADLKAKLQEELGGEAA